MNPLLLEVNRADLKKTVPSFRPGDTVRVAVRILEGEKERTQRFEGVCIRRHGSGMDETFTVRRVSYGVGMERIFPLHSPRVESIEVIRQGRVRRAKLYYLRDLTGKKARLSEVRRKRDAKDAMVDIAVPAEAAPAEEPAAAEVAAEAPEATTEEAAPQAEADASEEAKTEE